MASLYNVGVRFLSIRSPWKDSAEITIRFLPLNSPVKSFSALAVCVVRYRASSFSTPEALSANAPKLISSALRVISSVRSEAVVVFRVTSAPAPAQISVYRRRDYSSPPDGTPSAAEVGDRIMEGIFLLIIPAVFPVHQNQQPGKNNSRQNHSQRVQTASGLHPPGLIPVLNECHDTAGTAPGKIRCAPVRWS